MSPVAKWEYMKEIYPRYHQATKREKKRILDEFCQTYGCHRKHAIRLLNGPIPSPQRPKRRGKRQYSDSTLALIKGIWKEAGYPWSVLLKQILQDWLPWIRQRFHPTAEQERQLLAISTAQIDRRLAGEKRRLRRRIYGKTQHGALLKHQIPIKTDSWDVDRPGFTEIDLVSHSGNCAEGLFAYTLNVTDIHTAWDEAVTILGKGQETVREALVSVEEALPFPLLGVDSDNGSEFINDHLYRHFQDRKVQFTRGRPYKKDDNAHIEQKNWTHVRKLYGYVRYDTLEAVAAMNELNRNELRLFQNFFQPSVKLQEKVRKGSRLTRRYQPPQTPWQRIRESPPHDPVKVARYEALFKTLNPFELLEAIDQKLERIYRLSSTPKRHGSRPLPKILPTCRPTPQQKYQVHGAWRNAGIPRSPVFHSWTQDRDNPVLKFTQLHEKEKFLAG